MLPSEEAEMMKDYISARISIRKSRTQQGLPLIGPGSRIDSIKRTGHWEHTVMGRKQDKAIRDNYQKISKEEVKMGTVGTGLRREFEHERMIKPNLHYEQRFNHNSDLSTHLMNLTWIVEGGLREKLRKRR